MEGRWFHVWFSGKNRYWIHHAKSWCMERFGESTKTGPWVMHVTPSTLTYDSARVVVFFRRQEDMTWFNLTWG